jgi:RHS repeat-associated protein
VHNFTYDGQARLTRDTNPDGVSTDVSGTSVADGQQSTLTTPLGHTLTYVNGRQANGTWRRSRTDAAGASTVSTIAPDGTRGAVLADGRTTSVTPGSDPRFGVLAPFDKAVSVREPSSLTLTASSTRAVTLTDPSDPFSVATWTQTSTVGGATATRTFDGAARTLTLVSAGGLRSVRTIDVKSRTTRLVGDPALDAVTFSYDSAGRLTAGGQGVEHAAYAYDSRDRLVSVTDAAGRTTSYTYDAAGRVATATLAGGEVYAYEHDGLGHLTQVTLPGGGVQKIRWTPFGQSAGFVPAGGGPGYVIARDADGRRASTTLPSGRVESLARDAGGRVTSIAYPGASVDIAYAGATMRPASLTRTPDGGPSSSLALGYDGDLLTSLSSSGASSGSYALTYDERFELTRSVLTSGLSSVTTNITRDADGLVTAQGPFTLARGGPRGATTAISGGPLSVTQAWDGSGRVAERRDSVNGVDAYRMALTRGQSGNITSKVETVGAVAHTFDYAYDPNGRLTQVKRDESVVERYAYDADGNRTNRQIGADPPRIATFDVADRLTADGATAYVFDADGQLVSRGASDTFSYSARGELMAATVGGQAVSYAYDGFGRLVARTAAAGTWRYLYGNPDQQLQVTAAIEPDGTLDTLDYTDAGTVFSILRGATRLYVSTDQSGSARVFSDAAGAVVKAVQYSAYGEILSDSAPALQLPVGYAGGIPDSVTGLVHMGLRDYEPATGRFSTRDPLLLGGGDTNLYAYAGGDPIQHSDPLGLASAGGTVCEGVCVGMKWALTKDGFSACVEAGVGIGEDIEINPDGGLDTDKVYLKASGQLNAGPLANAELSDELSSDGNCVNGKLGSKACVVGYCVTESGDTSANPLGARDALKKKEIGFEAKVVVGVCQALRF